MFCHLSLSDTFLSQFIYAKPEMNGVLQEYKTTENLEPHIGSQPAYLHNIFY